MYANRWIAAEQGEGEGEHSGHTYRKGTGDWCPSFIFAQFYTYTGRLYYFIELGWDIHWTAVKMAQPESKKIFFENLSGAGKAIAVLTSGGDAQGNLLSFTDIYQCINTNRPVEGENTRLQLCDAGPLEKWRGRSYYNTPSIAQQLNVKQLGYKHSLRKPAS